MSYERIVRAFAVRPWAMLPSKLDAICAVIAARANGVQATEREIQAALALRKAGPAQPTKGAIAVIPLYGIVCQRMSMFSAFSGGTSLEDLLSAFDESMSDPQVSAIVLDIDSPGGSTYGVQEAFDHIFAARGGKPIIAACNPLAASAAYWLACAADEICCMPSGDVGSVGVYMLHEDFSHANAAAGYKPTYISAGPFKVDGNSDEPLSPTARTYMQKLVDDCYAEFVADVAQGRRTTPEAVQQTFGQGRVVPAADALKAGMIDRVETFDQTIARLQGRSGPVGNVKGRAMVAGSTTDRVAGVIPPDVSEHLAPKDTPWSRPNLSDFTDKSWDELTDAEKRHIAGHYAWAKEMPPESFGSLVLPHHRPSDGDVVFRGVVAAAGRLDQSEITAGDRPTVRKHLEKHYHQFDEKAPWELDASADERARLALVGVTMEMEARRA